MSDLPRVGYRDPDERRLWPWALLAFACLLALGAIVLYGFPDPDPPPEPKPASPVTVYRMPHMDLGRLVESVRSV